MPFIWINVAKLMGKCSLDYLNFGLLGYRPLQYFCLEKHKFVEITEKKSIILEHEVIKKNW